MFSCSTARRGEPLLQQLDLAPSAQTLLSGAPWELAGNPVWNLWNGAGAPAFEIPGWSYQFVKVR